MRKWIKNTGLVGLGVLLGGVSAGVVTARYYNQMFQQLYTIGVIDQTYIAREIRNGKGTALAKSIESTFPQYVLGLDQGFGQNEVTLPALRRIRDFYLETSTPMPEEIKPILNELLPKPKN